MTTSQIITAMRATGTIGSSSPGICRDMLKGIITDVYVMRNNKISKDDLDKMADIIMPRLLASYRHLTIEEVRIALEAGVTGEFRDCGTMPTAANCMGWLNCYARSSDRENANSIIKQNLKRLYDINDEGDSISDLERIQRNKQNAEEEPRRAFDVYRKQGRAGFSFEQYLDFCVFQPLDKLGRFRSMTSETAARLKKSAKQRMMDKKASIWDQKGENSATFQSFYHAEVVFAYFDALIQNGKQLDY